MSESCTHDCSNCQANCSGRDNVIPKEKLNEYSRVGHVIGVVSGKGGVGKSMVTSALAVEMAKRGYKVGILDADITGPSIPQGFGITEPATGSDLGIYPALSRSGIQIMSINMLLESPTTPVVWRGAMIAGAVKQFWTDVIWDVDYLFVDMPPGTGDVPLTVFQSLPVDGVVMVSSPQGLVRLIVEKCISMCNQMDIPVLGIVENMSYVKCPDCGSKIEIFGPSKLTSIANEHGIGVNVMMPIDPKLSAMVDSGNMDDANVEELDILASLLEIIDGEE